MNAVNLVDQNDFIEFVRNLGVPVEQHWTAQQCSEEALTWLIDQNEDVRSQFETAVTQLQENIPVMQPEVRDALEILIGD